MAKSIFCLLTCDASLDDAFFSLQFLSQLGESWQPIVMVPPLLLMPFFEHEHIISLPMGDSLDETYTRWQKVLRQAPPSLALLPDHLQTLQGNYSSTFSTDWLSELNCPLAILDCGDAWQSVSNSLPTPKIKGMRPQVEWNIPQSPQHLIKACPPAIANQNGAYSWQSQRNAYGSVAKYARRTEILDGFGAPSSAKVVLIYFNLLAQTLAVQNHVAAYYKTLVELLLHYFQQLDGDYLLLVVHPAHSLASGQYGNVTLQMFPTVPYDSANAFLSASDLLLTDTRWSYWHYEAAHLRVPSVLLASSVSVIEHGDMPTFGAEFETITPFNHQLLRDLYRKEPDAIFPHFNFPHRSDRWTHDPRWQDFQTFHHLVDVFNADETLKTFDAFLHDSNYLDAYKSQLDIYLARGRDAQDANTVIEAILSK